MNKKNQQLLLKLARDTLECSFKDEDPDTSQCMHLTQLRGSFITLYTDKKVRGCMGFPKPIMPLYEQIIAATKAAAFEDSRFDPLKEFELKNINIEISVLTRPELIKVNDPSDYLKIIEIGRDGLIIKSDSGSGLLLPQVAIEHNVTVEEFLRLLCKKADLNPDSWKDNKVKIYKFHAYIFSENNQ